MKFVIEQLEKLQQWNCKAEHATHAETVMIVDELIKAVRAIANRVEQLGQKPATSVPASANPMKYACSVAYSDDFKDKAWEVGSTDDVHGFNRMAVVRDETLAKQIVDLLIKPESKPTRAAKWISTVNCESDEIYFVMIDTVRDVPDLEGPYGTIKEAENARKTIQWQTQVMQLVPVEKPKPKEIKIGTAWGSFYETDPSGPLVAAAVQILQTEGLSEVTGALIKAIENIVADPAVYGFEGQAEYVKEAHRRIVEALCK